MADTYDDDYTHYSISSKVFRDFEFPEILHCVVEAKQLLNEDLESDHPSNAHADSVVGWLSASIFYTGGYPERGCYDLFDSVSQETQDAIEIILRCKKRIEEMAESRDVFDTGRFIVLQNLNVSTHARGIKLGLRLIREVAAVFGNFYTMLIIHAHPLEKGQGTAANVKKLTKYYKSDPYLCWEEIDPKKESGWLATFGGGGYAQEGYGYESPLFDPTDGELETPNTKL